MLISRDHTSNVRHLGDCFGSIRARTQIRNDLLTFMSNAILKSGKEIFDMRKPSNSMFQCGMSEHNSWVLDTGRQWVYWNIAGQEVVHLQSWNVWHELPSGMKWKFLRENEDQLRSQSLLSKLQRGKCNDFWKEIKALNLRRNPCHKQWRNFLGEQSCKLGKNTLIAIVNSVSPLTTEIMNALGTVPGHNDVINVHELRQNGSWLKNQKAVGNYEILFKLL